MKTLFNLFKITNERTFKVKVYAFFQFVSFGSYLAFLMSIGLMGYFLMVHGGTINDTKAWLSEFGAIILNEDSSILANAATTFFYFGLIGLTVSYSIGFSITLAKKRNLYDSLFLLFAIVPFISNLFAIMAQVSTKEISFAKTRIDKKALINAEFKKLEQTRLTTIKELEKSSQALKKIKESNEKHAIKNNEK